MKKKILSLVLVFLFMLTGIFAHMNFTEVYAEKDTGDTFQSINSVIDVGDKIYVQHGVNEDTGDIYNIYDLQKSGTGVTTVYETMIPEFTSGKAWTTSGEYMDNVAEQPHGATSPENYIPVTAGENYFIKTYGVGGVKVSDSLFYWYAPVLFMDDNDNVIADMLTNTLSQSKKGVIITVPEGATKMHLTMFNHQSFTLQKELNLTDEEFDRLPINRTQLENEINQTYEAYKEDQTLYKRLNKAYITFVNDDSRPGMDQYADLFLSKNVPLVLATIPELLIEETSSLTETRLEVARRVEAAGGEIIAHNDGVLTQEGFYDYNTMYSFFVRSKQLFNYYGFDVNGIILAGGAGQVAGAEESERWASSIYSYSDLYGVQYDSKDNVLESVYHHRRIGLSNYGNDIDKIKQEIDDAIENQKWIVFYFHDEKEISMDVLGEVLDYVNTKEKEELEVVTYKEMYQQNGAKESEVISTKNTYYVSSTGTSKSGISPEDPMSYEAACQKKYLSGDTILFKRGDTFYGTFSPIICRVDDQVTTISSYGEGELPVITGYKIADSQASWKLHADGIYKIDLTDTQYFSGLSTVDANSTNVGFLEDHNGNKYFNRKLTLAELESPYDFYCDGTCLYLKSEENPYTSLGELKLATKTNLLILKSGLKIENIMLSGTGAHGMVGSEASTENVEITNNIIQDIGGSYLYSNGTRYGNGIEFYGTDVSNVVVKNNIIRNTYDVGFTIQGSKGSGKNVVVRNNVFVSNTQDSEIWESAEATGVQGYEFTNNLSINQGRGWGYDARTDKYVAAHILFWQYLIEDTDIYFHHNIVYNPRRLYFAEQTNGTDVFFRENDCIMSDYNMYLCTEETRIFRDSYKVSEKDDFIEDFGKDEHSTFSLIDVEEAVIRTAAESNDIDEIRSTVTGDLPTLTRILQPAAITGVANGTELADISLPEKVTIFTGDGNSMSAAVMWDTDTPASGTYDPNVLTEQTFTLKGTVILPEEVINIDDLSLTTSITITVSEGEKKPEEPTKPEPTPEEPTPEEPTKPEPTPEEPTPEEPIKPGPTPEEPEAPVESTVEANHSDNSGNLAEAPKTRDNSLPGMWISFMIGSEMIFAGMALANKKCKKRAKRRRQTGV